MLTVGEVERLCQAYNVICQESPHIREYDYRTAENASEWRQTKLPLDL